MDCDGTGIVVASEKEQRESVDRGCFDTEPLAIRASIRVTSPAKLPL